MKKHQVDSDPAIRVEEVTMLFDSKLEDLKQEWAVRLGGNPDLEEIFVQALSAGGAA